MKRHSIIFIVTVISAVIVCASIITLVNGCVEHGSLSPELSDDVSDEEPGQDLPDEPKYMCFDGYYYKKSNALDEASVQRFVKKLNSMCESYLDDSNSVYWSVIPDKNYYLGEEGAPDTDFDYARLDSLLAEDIENGAYIGIYSALSLDSFYRTDIHWRQEKLEGVVSSLGDVMGFEINDEFTENTYDGYIGMYNENPDSTPLTSEDSESLIYLTSAPIFSSTVANYEDPDFTSVYDVDRLTGDTGYDIFLSGSTPITTVTSPDSKTEDRLIIFRDSFASSLAPLLLGHYREITLVDLRYIMSNLLADYVDFSGADVLFIYNVEVINRSIMLK